MIDRKQRIASAQITGLTAAHVQVKRLTRDETLAEIADVLAPFPKADRAAILADAAASYINDRYYGQASADLMTAAGADLNEARRIRADQDARPNPLTVVSDQANRADRT
jgi:hypothetical protein